MTVNCNANIRNLFVTRNVSIGGDVVINGTLTVGGVPITPATGGEYAYIYDEYDGFPIDVLSGDPIPFNSNGPISSNIMHTPGSTTITFNKTGVYLVTAYTQGTFLAPPSKVAQIGITINNVDSLGARYEAHYTSTTSGGKTINLQTIINANKGDVLRVVNKTNITYTLDPGTILDPVIIASLAITQVA